MVKDLTPRDKCGHHEAEEGPLLGLLPEVILRHLKQIQSPPFANENNRCQLNQPNTNSCGWGVLFSLIQVDLVMG
jgi:hypothetical protein